MYVWNKLKTKSRRVFETKTRMCLLPLQIVNIYVGVLVFLYCYKRVLHSSLLAIIGNLFVIKENSTHGHWFYFAFCDDWNRQFNFQIANLYTKTSSLAHHFLEFRHYVIKIFACCETVEVCFHRTNFIWPCDAIHFAICSSTKLRTPVMHLLVSFDKCRLLYVLHLYGTEFLHYFDIYFCLVWALSHHWQFICEGPQMMALHLEQC